jgi:hypothetical protein
MNGYEYGYARGEDTVWCIRKDGVKARMLCGREVGFVPVIQPEHPKSVHRDCIEAMYGAVQRAVDRPSSQVGYAVCPACAGEAAVFQGRLQAHGEWRVGPDGGRYQSEVPCVGVNLPARRKR